MGDRGWIFLAVTITLALWTIEAAGLMVAISRATDHYEIRTSSRR